MYVWACLCFVYVYIECSYSVYAVYCSLAIQDDASTKEIKIPSAQMECSNLMDN